MPKCTECKHEGKYSVLPVPYPIEMMVGMKLGMPGKVNVTSIGFEEEARKHGFTKDDLSKKGMRCQAPGGGPTQAPIVLIQAMVDQPCDYFAPKSIEFQGRKKLLVSGVMLLIGFVVTLIPCVSWLNGGIAAVAWIQWEKTLPANATKRGVVAGLLAGIGGILAYSVSDPVVPLEILTLFLLAILTGALTGHLFSRKGKSS